MIYRIVVLRCGPLAPHILLTGQAVTRCSDVGVRWRQTKMHERVRQFEGIVRAAKRKLEALNAASRHMGDGDEQTISR
jgi:hypothetical protein